MMFWRKIVLALSPLLFVAGCGGGSQSVAVVPLTSSLSAYQNGWSWSYNFSGSFTPSGGTSQAATGTRTVLCSSTTASAVSLQETTTISAGGSTYSHVNVFQYTQGSDGSLVLTSFTIDSNPTESVSKTTFKLPGQITATSYVNGVTTYQDTTTGSDLFQVVGIQVVDTPVAQFSTWQASRRMEYQNQTLFSQTEDISPTIGAPVSNTEQATVSDGAYSGTFLLQSTNVALSSQTQFNTSSGAVDKQFHLPISKT